MYSERGNEDDDDRETRKQGRGMLNLLTTHLLLILIYNPTKPCTLYAMDFVLFQRMEVGGKGLVYIFISSHFGSYGLVEIHIHTHTYVYIYMHIYFR